MEFLNDKTPEEYLTDMVSDLFMNFLYYDRKQCEQINVEQMREYMDNGTFPKEMMLEVFKNQIENEY